MADLRAGSVTVGKARDQAIQARSKDIPTGRGAAEPASTIAATGYAQ
jgi:hypothetical protein